MAPDEPLPFVRMETIHRGKRMKEHIQRVQHSSTKSDWRTPPALYVALDDEFSFDVDVAADATNTLCDRYYDEETNGLTQQWTQGEIGDPGIPYRCFMNPPYAKAEKLDITPWIKKAWEESQNGATVVGVLPFNPQTAWYRTWVYGQFTEHKAGWMGHAAMEERRLSHRVTFNRPDGTPADNAPGNTVIIVWKSNPGFIGPWTPAVRYWSFR